MLILFSDPCFFNSAQHFRDTLNALASRDGYLTLFSLQSRSIFTGLVQTNTFGMRRYGFCKSLKMLLSVEVHSFCLKLSLGSLTIAEYRHLYLELELKDCEANPAGEYSSFIFTACVKSVPLYHFKLAFVVLHMFVKESFETTSKMEKQAVLILRVILDQP